MPDQEGSRHTRLSQMGASVDGKVPEAHHVVSECGQEVTRGVCLLALEQAAIPVYLVTKTSGIQTHGLCKTNQIVHRIAVDFETQPSR